VNFLARQDLVDEYWLMVYPIVVGKGKRLFEEGTSIANLKLREAKMFDAGVALLRYDVSHGGG
jgi:dihydrofolate reductase